jgi:hypothetical protein
MAPFVWHLLNQANPLENKEKGSVSSESEFIMKYQEVEFVALAMLLDTDYLSAYISHKRKEELKDDQNMNSRLLRLCCLGFSYMVKPGII